MHRTYSMRQSRAPTASQIQNPPPPSSTTKSGRFFGKAGLGVFFFSLSWVSFPKSAHRFPLLAIYNPSSLHFFQHEGLSGISVLFRIFNTISPFFIAMLRPQTMPIPRLNHIVTSHAHDSTQCPSCRLPAVICIIAAKLSSWSNYHYNRPFSDQKTNRFFSRRCGPCVPQNHRRCLRP